MHRFPLLTLMAALAASAGCNQYELFRRAGHQQESFSNKADILFVMDNSSSMAENSASLAVNFGQFIERLAAKEEAQETDDLADAVGNYLDYVQNRAANLDYQFGLTTTSIENDSGKLLGAGLLAKGDEGLQDLFVEALLCEGTCFVSGEEAGVGNDPGHLCGDPIGDVVTRQYLDCACGTGEWLNKCGSAKEEGLEAVFLAMCRSVPNPPLACFEDVEVGGEIFPASLKKGDTNSNGKFLRDNATFIPVIISDEGDSSRRLENSDEIPEAYLHLFKAFGKRIAWVVIGPTIEDDDVPCSGTANTWGVFRYEFMVYDSNGLKVDIAKASDCSPTNFGTALDQLGALLKNLASNFQLQAIPDQDTIRVVVDGKRVTEATSRGENELGLPTYTDGWIYRPDDNSIVFYGAAVPPLEADVQVFYLPLNGMPRDLPF
jgi:hypothetical protein